MKNSKKAFTLAEILLTMAIIGIVGIIAVSGAKKDTDVTEKIAQLRRSYEVIDTAFASAVAENGNITNWGSTISDRGDVIFPHFKFNKICKTSSGCWRNAKQLKLDNSESSITMDSNSSYYKGILANGASIAIINDTTKTDQKLKVSVDVNGPDKGMNKYGDDVFSFYVLNDGIVLPYAAGTSGQDVCSSGGDGETCTAWAIKFGNMDYLLAGTNNKCPDNTTLSWTGSHTCRRK